MTHPRSVISPESWNGTSRVLLPSVPPGIPGKRADGRAGIPQPAYGPESHRSIYPFGYDAPGRVRATSVARDGGAGRRAPLRGPRPM